MSKVNKLPLLISENLTDSVPNHDGAQAVEPEMDFGTYFVYTNYDLILDPQFYVVLRDYIFTDHPLQTIAEFTHKTIVVR